MTVAALAVVVATLQPACYHESHKQKLDEVSWGALFESSQGGGSAMNAHGDSWKCISHCWSEWWCPHHSRTSTEGTVSDLLTEKDEAEAEREAIFQRLSLAGIIVMLATGFGILMWWIETDEPELIANACIYFAVNGLAIGVFGRMIVGYFYTSVLGVAFIVMLLFMTLNSR